MHSKKKTFLNVVKDNLIKNVIEKTCLQRKLPIEEEKKKNLTISTSLRSQQVLAMKFIKEFNEIVTELGIIKDEIDINSTMLILHKLNFIKNDPKSSNFEEESILILRL